MQRAGRATKLGAIRVLAALARRLRAVAGCMQNTVTAPRSDPVDAVRYADLGARQPRPVDAESGITNGSAQPLLFPGAEPCQYQPSSEPGRDPHGPRRGREHRRDPGKQRRHRFRGCRRPQRREILARRRARAQLPGRSPHPRRRDARLVGPDPAQGRPAGLREHPADVERGPRPRGEPHQDRAGCRGRRQRRRRAQGPARPATACR